MTTSAAVTAAAAAAGSAVAKPQARIFGRILGGNEARQRYRVFGTFFRKTALLGGVLGLQFTYAIYRDVFVHGL